MRGTSHSHWGTHFHTHSVHPQGDIPTFGVGGYKEGPVLVLLFKSAQNFYFLFLSLLDDTIRSVRGWIGPKRFSRLFQQLERTEGESELHHLARVAAASLAGVQGIGDWGHDSDGKSIEHDVLRDFHSSIAIVSFVE